MKSYTVDELMAEGPCYHREQIMEWFEGRECVTMLDIAKHPCVSDVDKVWVFCRDNEHRFTWSQRVLPGYVCGAIGVLMMARSEIIWQTACCAISNSAQRARIIVQCMVDILEPTPFLPSVTHQA